MSRPAKNMAISVRGQLIARVRSNGGVVESPAEGV